MPAAGARQGGNVKLYTDGKRVAEGDIPASLAMLYSVDEGCDVGEDRTASVIHHQTGGKVARGDDATRA